MFDWWMQLDAEQIPHPSQHPAMFLHGMQKKYIFGCKNLHVTLCVWLAFSSGIQWQEDYVDKFILTPSASNSSEFDTGVLKFHQKSIFMVAFNIQLLMFMSLCVLWLMLQMFLSPFKIASCSVRWPPLHHHLLGKIRRRALIDSFCQIIVKNSSFCKELIQFIYMYTPVHMKQC